jgi:hypothetical protein
MSAVKFLDLAEEQGLLEPQVIATLRKQLQAKPNITAQIVAKTLTDKGLLTAFQAKKLLTTATAVEKRPELELDLTIEEPASPASTPPSKAPPPTAKDDSDVPMLEAAEPPVAPKVPAPASKPKAPAPTAASKPKPTPPSPASDLFDLAPLDEQPLGPPPEPASKPIPTTPARAEKPKSAPSTKPAAPADLTPVDLEPLEPLEPSSSAPQASPAQPKPKPSAPVSQPAPPPTLPPLDLDPLSTTSADGGLDDLLAPLPGADADPFAQPATADSPLSAPPAEKPAKQGFQKKVGRANVWDSPLLLIGGGLLLVLIAAIGLMFFSITRGSAQQAFDKASEEYANGNYAAAETAFHHFLEKYKSDKRASQARVMQGLARLRQSSSNAKADPRTALRAAQEILPTIEREEAFNDARGELVHILPEISSGFAEQAKATDKIERLVDLTKLAEESLALVNNPSYLSPDDRKNIEVRISNIMQMLAAASRSIAQDKDLQAAITTITKLCEEGKTAEAYQVRRDVVRKFPALERNKQLTDATYAICEREKQAVRLSESSITPSTDDPHPVGPRIVLASRSTGGEEVANTRPVFLMIEGAVYALELGNGKVLWRRYVGHETHIAPIPVSRDPAADVLVTDGRTNDLYRLEAATGKIRWRLPIGEPFHTPTLADDKLLVATHSGKLLEVNLSSGASDRRLILPQKLTVSPAWDAKNSRYYQLGEHSTLFVINSSLACEETFYIGHKAGAIIVPPVVALEHLLIVESPADDHSLLHVLARDPEKKQMREIDRELRLKGRVVTPIGHSGRRITVVTDLGEVNAFEVDPAIKDRPLQPVGRIEASEAAATLLYHATDGSRLWLAGRRCTMFEIQVSLQQLGRKWSNHENDAFLGPPQVFGETVVHVRRRPNTSAVLVEASQVADGRSIWTTQLAAPLVGLVADTARKHIVAVTEQAHAFEMPASTVAVGYYDQTSFIPKQGTGTVVLRGFRKLTDERFFAIGNTGYPFVLLYDVSSASDRTKLVTLGAAAKEVVAPAVAYKQGLVLPLSSGLVQLIDPNTTQRLALPFQPELAPGARLNWNEPVVLEGDRAVVIGDGKEMLYRIAVKEGAQIAFNKDAEVRLEGTVVSPVAAVNDFVCVVVRGDGGDFLQIAQAGNLAPGAKLPLGGRWKSGPTVVGDKVLVELQEHKLLCVEQDRQTWLVDLPRGPLSAPPQRIDNDLLLIHAGGSIVRANLADGKELAAVEIGEPLGEVVTTYGPRLLIGGRDGVLHIAIPPTVSAEVSR